MTVFHILPSLKIAVQSITPKMEKVLLIQSNGTLIDYSFGYQQPFIFQHKTPLPFYNKYYGFTHGIEYNWGGRGELKPITPRNTCRQ